MWVGQLRGDVQFEAFMVRDDCVTQLQHCASLLLKCLQAREKKATSAQGGAVKMSGFNVIK